MTFMMSLFCTLIDLGSEKITLTSFPTVPQTIQLLKQIETWWVDIVSIGDQWELKDTGWSGSSEATGSLTFCNATATK